MFPVIKVAELIIHPQHFIAKQGIFRLALLILKLPVELLVGRSQHVIQRLDVVLRYHGGIVQIPAANRHMRIRMFRKAGYPKGKIPVVILAAPPHDFPGKQCSAYVRRSKLLIFPFCTAGHDDHSGLTVI